MKIVVVGTGYVGLVTGTCLSEVGNEVVCVDINKAKIEQLQAGGMPIYEPSLDVMVDRNVREGRLSFTVSLAEAMHGAQMVFLALPTPPNENGLADLSYVLAAAEELGRLLTGYVVVVNKSTVPVGTLGRVQETLRRHTKAEFDVVSNPEFLREGRAIEDFMKPDRIVIGSTSERANAVMRELYEPFTQAGSPLLVMDPPSAEMTKYAANAFLATKISFMNEMANISEKVGANIDMIRAGIGADSRIGSQFLLAGIGYGGSCFPKDVQALYKTSAEYDYNFQILGAVNGVNEAQRRRLSDKVKDFFDGELKGKRIALWGLAFKPETDDIREAPALYLIKDLRRAGAVVTAYDPVAMPNVERIMGSDVKLAADPYEAADGADALLVVTEWDVFRAPDFKRLRKVMRRPVMFDGRNLFELEHMRAQGFYYNSIGRPVVEAKAAHGK